uniref:Uncharacterized protein n=1 Tax=Triticum urartu TaxID=4572 RepID=A0A8R7U764_TRIUA
ARPACNPATRRRLLPAPPHGAPPATPSAERRHRLPASHLDPRAPDPAIVRRQHLRIRLTLAFPVYCTSQRRHPTPAMLCLLDPHPHDQNGSSSRSRASSACSNAAHILCLVDSHRL